MSVNAFSDEYEPKTIVGREGEQRAIYYYLKDVSRGRSSKILYIRGIPGIGKTTVTRAVINQFEESNSRAVVAYMNCRNSSYYKCLLKIHSKCFDGQKKRLTSDRILRAFTKRIIRKLVLVCVLDNFDRIRDLEKFISAFNEIRKTMPRFGLIMISTGGNEIMEMIGKRLYSVLRFEVLDFEPYTLNQPVEIMKSRLVEAFRRNIAEELALFEIASFVRRTSQNVRDAFHILEDAMELAQEGKSVVSDGMGRKYQA